jgi:hypothetical protein
MSASSNEIKIVQLPWPFDCTASMAVRWIIQWEMLRSYFASPPLLYIHINITLRMRIWSFCSKNMHSSTNEIEVHDLYKVSSWSDKPYKRRVVYNLSSFPDISNGQILTYTRDSKLFVM